MVETMSELRLIIDPKTGNLKTVQLVAPDIESQSEGFKAYQALANEINRFSERATKLLRLERALGRI